MITLAFSRFARSRSGNVAIMFAVALLPIAYLVSAVFDFARSGAEKTRLQSIVDAAALAGVQAYAANNSSSSGTSAVSTYMASAAGQLHGTGLNYTSSPTAANSGGLVSAYTMKVAATERVSNNALAAAWTGATTLGANATATIGMSYTATFKLNNFSSNACDGNSVYWYIVPPDNSAPPASSLTKVWSNTDPSNPDSLTMTIRFGDKIGFALKNVTGQQCAYGKTAFGATPNQINWFYSNLSPPSKVAFPSVTQNCSLTTVLDPLQTQLPPAIAGNLGTCSATLPNYAALDCSSLVGHTVLYLWNDMGGVIDDRDYNDANYTVSCAIASGGITAGTGATLNR